MKYIPLALLSFLCAAPVTAATVTNTEVYEILGGHFAGETLSYTYSYFLPDDVAANPTVFDPGLQTSIISASATLGSLFSDTLSDTQIYLSGTINALIPEVYLYFEFATPNAFDLVTLQVDVFPQIAILDSDPFEATVCGECIQGATTTTIDFGNPAPVPVPLPVALMASGIAALAAMGWRRRRSSAA